MRILDSLKSKLSWRITLTVFATILLVQTITLILNVNQYEKDLLQNLRKTAQSSIFPTIDTTVKEKIISPIGKDVAAKLLDKSIVEGMTIYNDDNQIVGSYGMQTLLLPTVNANGAAPEYRSVDGKFYEVLFTSDELKMPYYIVAKLDSSDIEPKLVGHVHKTLFILSLLSAIVTIVLMFVLEEWLLGPIGVLRENLLTAANNPENPQINPDVTNYDDEIGVAINIANRLIKQNSNNLKRLKTQAEDKIHKLAYFDSLTGLPNRTYFLEKLEEIIKHNALNEGFKLAVLSVDLDHFKDINDTMGHEVGDMLLNAVGKRLSRCLPTSSIVSRASADEFMVMVPLDAEIPESSLIVENILASMQEPVTIMQESFQVKVSIGVAHYPHDSMDAKSIVKNADIALNRAKEEGRDTVRYYSEEFDRAIQQRFQMLRDLRVALEKKQLQVYYHPQFDLKNGHLIGAECLIRWLKPNENGDGFKFISPVEFIPVAEQSGLIVPIGEFVLRTACENNKRWQAEGYEPFRIAVNLSGDQFHKCDIVKLTKEVLQETRLDPKWLELEVTESVFMENMQMAIDILHQLKGLGVELAIDDFGTGYSSLSYLRQFPIDRLKIDQSFTKNSLVDKDDMSITKTIIQLGHSLGLKVIAEGVETIEHEVFLRNEGCDESQGYLYSKPIPEKEFLAFVKKCQTEQKEKRA